MATWQFDLRGVPREDLIRHFGATPVRVKNQDLDEADSIFPCNVDSISDRIADLLPRKETWSSDLVQFGTEDGTRVDLWTSGTRIEEMSVRMTPMS